jgi:AraC-like DNA-binding protein
MDNDFSRFPLVLVRARVLTGFAELVSSLGGDPAALMAGVGLTPAMLDAPEEPLLLARALVLRENAAAALGVPDFGLRLAQRQDINVLGPIALSARYAASLGEALAAVARNLPYHNPGLRMTMTPDEARSGHTLLRIQIDAGAALEKRQTIEQGFGIANHFLRMTSGENGAEWTLQLRHAALPGVDYARYFHGPVLCGQQHDALSFPSRLLGVKLAPESGVLQAAAQRYVSSLIHRFPLDITRQVEALVERQLANGGCDLVQVAGMLGLHQRTLQRRLREQGAFFEEIVDRLRRRRAEEFLALSTIPLAEVASLLGYSEQSSFIRVCKRWFGATPHAFRLQCLRPDGAATRLQYMDPRQ